MFKSLIKGWELNNSKLIRQYYVISKINNNHHMRLIALLAYIANDKDTFQKMAGNTHNPQYMIKIALNCIRILKNQPDKQFPVLEKLQLLLLEPSIYKTYESSKWNEMLMQTLMGDSHSLSPTLHTQCESDYEDLKKWLNIMDLWPKYLLLMHINHNQAICAFIPKDVLS